jgi:hypothetical protein
MQRYCDWRMAFRLTLLVASSCNCGCSTPAVCNTALFLDRIIRASSGSDNARFVAQIGGGFLRKWGMACRPCTISVAKH